MTTPSFLLSHSVSSAHTPPYVSTVTVTCEFDEAGWLPGNDPFVDRGEIFVASPGSVRGFYPLVDGQVVVPDVPPNALFDVGFGFYTPERTSGSPSLPDEYTFEVVFGHNTKSLEVLADGTWRWVSNGGTIVGSRSGGLSVTADMTPQLLETEVSLGVSTPGDGLVSIKLPDLEVDVGFSPTLHPAHGPSLTGDIYPGRKLEPRSVGPEDLPWNHMRNSPILAPNFPSATTSLKGVADDIVVIVVPGSVMYPWEDSTKVTFLDNAAGAADLYAEYDNQKTTYAEEEWLEYGSGTYVVSCRIGFDGMLEYLDHKLLMNWFGDAGGLAVDVAQFPGTNRVFCMFEFQDSSDVLGYSATQASIAGRACSVDPSSGAITVQSGQHNFFVGTTGAHKATGQEGSFGVTGMTESCVVVGWIARRNDLSGAVYTEPFDVMYPGTAYGGFSDASWWAPMMQAVWYDANLVETNVSNTVTVYYAPPDLDESRLFNRDIWSLGDDRGVWTFTGIERSGESVVFRIDGNVLTTTFSRWASNFTLDRVLTNNSYTYAGGMESNNYEFGSAAPFNDKYFLASAGAENMSFTPGQDLVDTYEDSPNESVWLSRLCRINDDDTVEVVDSLTHASEFWVIHTVESVGNTVVIGMNDHSYINNFDGGQATSSTGFYVVVGLDPGTETLKEVRWLGPGSHWDWRNIDVPPLTE